MNTGTPSAPDAEASQPLPLSRKGKLLLAGAVVCVLFAGLWFGREPFRQWQERRLTEAAQNYLEADNLRAAYLASQEALQKNPNSARACEIIAAVGEKQRIPSAIGWRQRVVDLRPGESGPLIALAACAIAFGESYVAEQALVRVPPTARETIAFRRAAASLAVSLKQYAAAADHLEKALARFPKDEALQLELATVWLALGDAAKAEAARVTLGRLVNSRGDRVPALRTLVGDARQRNDRARALQLAGELTREADAKFGDRLLWIEELQHAGSPQFESELERLRAEVRENAPQIFETMTWMNGHGLAKQTLEWGEALPVLTRSQQPIPLALAEAAAATGDWKQLGGLVNDGDWGELDFVRLAIRARWIEETASSIRGTNFKTAWERALHATNGNPYALSMLARLVTGWGWKDEALQTWWLVANNTSGQRPALKVLYELYAAERNTRELYRVARRVLELEPNSPVAKNNVAMLGLLLGEDEAANHRLAEQAFRVFSNHPVVATTYAFSLHRQKRTAEAMEVVRRIPQAALEDPSIAACYGLLLAESGETSDAKRLLEGAAKRSNQLFPEESALVADALQRIL